MLKWDGAIFHGQKLEITNPLIGMLTCQDLKIGNILPKSNGTQNLMEFETTEHISYVWDWLNSDETSGKGIYMSDKPSYRQLNSRSNTS